MAGTANGKKHRSTNRKKTAKGMFIKGFLQSFFIVVILLGAAVIGYQSTLKLWTVEKKQVKDEVVETPTPEPITTASVDDVSKNLIFSYNKEDNRISRMLLEVYHCGRKELTYITIPVSTKLTMSDSLYRKLVVIRPEMPQMLRLSTITKYLEGDTVFEYSVLMMEDLLDIGISYYTVVPEKLFVDIFEGTSSSELQFTAEFKKKLGKLKGEEQIAAYLEELYPQITSNLTIEEKLNYVESYSQTPLERVAFTRIPGAEVNSGFELDEPKTAVLLQGLLSEE